MRFVAWSSYRTSVKACVFGWGWPAYLRLALLSVLLCAPAAAHDLRDRGGFFSEVAVPPVVTPRQMTPLAQGSFLVATPGMLDPNFAESVVLLLEYSDAGAMGLVVNRPTHATLARLLPDVAWLQGRSEVVFLGGPVAPEQVIILVRSVTPPTPAEHVIDDIYATGSEKVLRGIVESEDPGEMFRVYAGYAGWAPGQLEGEVARGGWRLAPGDSATVFEVPSHDVWPALIQRTSGDWVGPAPSPATLARHSSSAPGQTARAIPGWQ